MLKKDIKNIMVCHYDNDFVRVFDWIGKVTLTTLLETNICGEEMLETSDDIEAFIHSLLPTAIEFTQYKCGRNRQTLEEDTLTYLSSYFKKMRFKYNFDYETDDEYISGGSELLIIDLQNKQSYIR
jgi:hypothetical protein